MIEFYKKLNLLKVIDGERSIDQINKEISDIIALYRVDIKYLGNINTHLEL